MYSSLHRAGLLFSAGASFALFHRLLILQRETKLLGLSEVGLVEVLLATEARQWITQIVLSCAVGAIAAVLGFVWPLLEERIGKVRSGLPKSEWTGVLRCSACFIGINHASAKVEYPSTLQLAVTLAALCCCLWWGFDRSLSGLGAGFLAAFVAAVTSKIYTAFFQQSSFGGLEWFEWQLWTPYIFFSGGVTMIILGRHLLACSDKDSTDPRVTSKPHEE